MKDTIFSCSFCCALRLLVNKANNSLNKTNNDANKFVTCYLNYKP